MNKAARVAAGLLTFELLVRSVDYATGNSYNNGILDDNISTPEVWGYTGLAAVVVLLFGLILGRDKVVQFGGVCAFSIYTMLAIQVFEVRMLPFPWPPEDSRLFSTNAVFAGLWLLLTVTIWWRSYIAKLCTDELDRKVQGE